MEMNQYQAKAMETCVEKSANTAYMLTGLTAEVGEINDKVAKWIRKGYARLGVSLEDVAQMNIQKLASRKKRGVIVGEGDNR